MKRLIIVLLSGCLAAQSVDRVIPLSEADAGRLSSLSGQVERAKKAYFDADEALRAAEDEFSQKNCPKHALDNWPPLSKLGEEQFSVPYRCAVFDARQQNFDGRRIIIR